MVRFLALCFVFLTFLDPDVVAQARTDPTNDIAIPYRDTANRIIEAAMADSSAYERLAYLTDTFGPRLSGSQNLEEALDWILSEMHSDDLEHVRGEPVLVPKWVRGEEALMMIQPRQHRIQLLGLGGSVGTPPEGITAPVLVVRTFDELEAKREQANGKIVLFNAPFTSYGETVRYRYEGAVRAARAGAIASLVRSVASGSLYTPHTGAMGYEEGVPKIPHAAIPIEDAMMMQRMQDRGQQITVQLYMEAKTLPDVWSRNVVAEIVGREKPEEVVVLGGHIDSWDVGQGAMDDAGGCVAAWEVLRLLKTLGIRPRRTIRVVFWANEENGLRGGTEYRNAHVAELDQHVLALETDSGIFAPKGFGFTGTDSAFALVQQIGHLLDPIGAGTIVRGGGGADISPLMRAGVPGMGLSVDGADYFKYHHSPADTVDKIDPYELNQCIAALAIMTYVVADMPQRLPRNYIQATH